MPPLQNPSNDSPLNLPAPLRAVQRRCILRLGVASIQDVPDRAGIGINAKRAGISQKLQYRDLKPGAGPFEVVLSARQIL